MSARAPPRPGILKADTIIDVADSLGITNLSDTVANALASDVEYRLHQIIQEAARFTRHSRRTMMTTSDVDQAFKTLNIEPAYGHTSHNAPTFRRVQPTSGPPIYVVDDDDIDFEVMLKQNPIPVPRKIRYAAHWLAIEGVQPLIPENPPPETPPAVDAPQAATTHASPAATQNGPLSQPTPDAKASKDQPVKAPSVKTHLSRELQHYYQILVSALSPSMDDRKKTAALTSLRADAGLSPVLPYIARWIGEGVVASLRRDSTDGEDVDFDRKSLDIYLDAISALLENDRLFVEPYLHQLLPPILSILLTSTLPTPPIIPTDSTDPSPSQLRTHAASVLSRLLTQHSPTYPSLSSRVTKTLLAALIDPGRMLGTREGALRGLTAVGKEAVRRGLVQAGGGTVVGEDMDRATEMGMDTRGVQQAMMDALEILHPRTTEQPAGSPPRPLNDMDDDDRTAADLLIATIGDSFSRTVGEDGRWAKKLAKSFNEGIIVGTTSS
ncbi:TATA box binding protein associated factor-domain-containing protein [Cantharellus anzutake]|uniref:TATA box binding protein associated factor-domain-containing protein n=1 Tax=Cantharellus anzutake TaxID=1750568 RepID=UPI0019086019|nr:TATA box binding protein associated factor-domain-containing protein [Cantharellus anzutake]KAF8333466.1 TATA box binding protein associated factor-domain-containing protein [Cantharellus anzutake]